MKYNDITLAKSKDDEGNTIINPINELGKRVLNINLPGAGDFSVLGAPVEVKLPLDVVKSLIRGRGASFETLKAAKA